MHGPNSNYTKSFKQAFLKNLLLSLQECSKSSSKAMSLQERKHAVKTCANIAMATAHGAAGASRWPKALLAAASMPCKVQRCNKIVRRCCHKKRRGGSSSTSSSDIARRLVKRRTMVLKKMIPGGESLDEASLLHEAVDYVLHLRDQVDVLWRISKAVQRSSLRGSCSQCTSMREQ